MFFRPPHLLARGSDVAATARVPVPARGARVGAVLGLLFAVGLGPGCITYRERTAEAMSDFQRGQLASSQEKYGDPDVVGSEFLAGAEGGTVALTAGDWERSLYFLSRAAEAARDVEGRALANPEKLGESLLSWGLNDRFQTYLGEGYERVTVHALLALCYLALGQRDGVGVEVRRANQLLEAEERLYEREYQAGGLGHFVSALNYELGGELDEAYIDYTRMEAKSVGKAIAGRALVRIATRLGRADDLPRLEETYGPDLERPEGAASVVVIAGVGLGPYKVEGRLWVPTGDGLVAVAVPEYESRRNPVTGLRLVESQSGDSVLCDVIEDVSKVARDNLNDRLLWVSAKSVARGLLKRELTKALADQHGDAGLLIGNLFAVVTERADLRCWETLPETWQACRLFVPPGEHAFELQALGGDAVSLGRFELEPGETLLVLARTVGTTLYAYPIGGRRLDDPVLEARGAASVTGSGTDADTNGIETRPEPVETNDDA